MSGYREIGYQSHLAVVFSGNKFDEELWSVNHTEIGQFLILAEKGALFQKRHQEFHHPLTNLFSKCFLSQSFA